MDGWTANTLSSHPDRGGANRNMEVGEGWVECYVHTLTVGGGGGMDGL